MQYFAWGLFNAGLMVIETNIRKKWLKKVSQDESNNSWLYHFRHIVIGGYILIKFEDFFWTKIKIYNFILEINRLINFS